MGEVIATFVACLREDRELDAPDLTLFRDLGVRRAVSSISSEALEEAWHVTFDVIQLELDRIVHDHPNPSSGEVGRTLIGRVLRLLPDALQAGRAGHRAAVAGRRLPHHLERRNVVSDLLDDRIDGRAAGNRLARLGVATAELHLAADRGRRLPRLPRRAAAGAGRGHRRAGGRDHRPGVRPADPPHGDAGACADRPRPAAGRAVRVDRRPPRRHGRGGSPRWSGAGRGDLPAAGRPPRRDRPAGRPSGGAVHPTAGALRRPGRHAGRRRRLVRRRRARTAAGTLRPACDLLASLYAVHDADGDLQAAADALGLAERTVRDHLRRAAGLLEIDHDGAVVGGDVGTALDLLRVHGHQLPPPGDPAWGEDVRNGDAWREDAWSGLASAEDAQTEDVWSELAWAEDAWNEDAWSGRDSA